MSIAKFTWKEYGLSIQDLKFSTLPQQLLEYEEMMMIANDYEIASHEDSKPPRSKG